MSIQPVLIIGSGPTGLTAAMELSRFGVPVRLIDKAAGPSKTSRAIGVQARTLELLEQRGIVDELLKIGNPSRYVGVYDAGRRVFQIDFDHVDSRFKFIFFVSQAETEKTLRDQLARQGVNTEWNTELVGFTQSSEHDENGGVTATFRHGDGRLEWVRGSYLIAADGAHSVIRSTLGIHFQGKPLPDAYVLGDVFADGDLPPIELHIFSSAHGFMGMFPMGNQHFRLIASNPLSKPSEDTAPSLEELQKIYDQRSHIPAKLHDMVWSSWFHINSRMVDRMQVGRTFLIGDAAHIHSPAGGQGMNTGIQDAINLGWKLAAVLNGSAGHELLETYSAERTAVIKGVLNKTEKLTEAVGAENQLFRSVFDHLAPMVVGTEFVQTAASTNMSQIGVNYRGGPMSESHRRAGHLHAGDRMPLEIPVISEGKSLKLIDLLNPSAFVLLIANADTAESTTAASQQLKAWASQLQIKSIRAGGGEDGHAFRHAFGAGPINILVRPDGYAGYIAAADDIGSIEKYLRKWLAPRSAH